jgi:mRNA interferase MazF
MVSNHWIPLAGEFISIDFDPQSGHEQAGRRPALVISEVAYNQKAGLALVCPVTNQVKGYPFEVSIPSGQQVTGVVLSDQVKCLDWKARRARKLSTAPPTVLADVRQRLKLILGIK